ncbi:MAG: malonate decarboxylase holo-[acyl-carrier-protein] synthase [Pseudomonadota bacterium]|nr:malonate decarboxylase holo-[acyl-carrier-protein] synthase [Pseudomonadota bacterium]
MTLGETLRRHQLVRPSAEGWRQAIDQHDDAGARQSLLHWSAHDLPVVVCTQGSGGLQGGCVALGLPTPPDWGRQRIRLSIDPAQLRCEVAEFPRWESCREALPLSHAARALLDRALDADAGDSRVYGSFGWQQLTGLQYVNSGSDIDLLLEPRDPAHADRLASALFEADTGRPRLDGELCFHSGSDIAWREWLQWRAGRVDGVVVKRLHGPVLVNDAARLTETRAAVSTS